jgi:hypothetical protein
MLRRALIGLQSTKDQMPGVGNWGLSSSGTENLHKASDLPLVSGAAADNQFPPNPPMPESNRIRTTCPTSHGEVDSRQES